jgi:hypothetical protein
VPTGAGPAPGGHPPPNCPAGLLVSPSRTGRDPLLVCEDRTSARLWLLDRWAASISGPWASLLLRTNRGSAAIPDRVPAPVSSSRSSGWGGALSRCGGSIGEPTTGRRRGWQGIRDGDECLFLCVTLRAVRVSLWRDTTVLLALTGLRHQPSGQPGVDAHDSARAVRRDSLDPSWADASLDHIAYANCVAARRRQETRFRRRSRLGRRVGSLPRAPR